MIATPSRTKAETVCQWRRALGALTLCLASLPATADPRPGSAAAARPTPEQQAEALLGRLSLEEKIGQMIQAEILDVKAAMRAGQHPVRDLHLGSLLAGGDSIIPPNTPESWRGELAAFQAEATASGAGLPLLIGVDAVHGHGLVPGATIFPHNIGLGAARDPEVMRQMGAVVASEVLATGFNWTFAPAVTVARDERWGRTYESFGEAPELQHVLVKPYVLGLQGTPVGAQSLVATAKHFIGDGGTTWGTGLPAATTNAPQIDRGDTRGDLETLLALHGQGYQEAIAANVDTVMASYSSINGQKMHGNGTLIADYLKKPRDQGGLGFDGFVISDWNAIDELDAQGATDPLTRYENQLVQSVNAGVDMIMVFSKLDLPGGKQDSEFRFARVHELLLKAAGDGRIAATRIDDAVRRILRIKIKSGLLDRGGEGASVTDAAALAAFGSAAHRQIARAAARESLVLLKNQASVLPITAAKYQALCVAGTKADDLGVQAGAWTAGWQGTVGNAVKRPGAKTILDGLKAQAASRGLALEYAPDGAFQTPACQSGSALVLAVAGEKPYAEFKGDTQELGLKADDLVMLAKAQATKAPQAPLAVVLIAGRPLMVTDQLPGWQALVAAWLPGSQGEAVADVLFGDFDFHGRLSQTWPASVTALPVARSNGALFPYGYGLDYAANGEATP